MTTRTWYGPRNARGARTSPRSTPCSPPTTRGGQPCRVRDTLRAEQKALGRAIGAAAPDETTSLLVRAKQLADEVKAAEADQADADEALREAHLAVPNLVEDGVPPGGEDDFVTLETVGTPPQRRRAARPRRDRRGIAGDRHRARREGQRRAVLLPHRRRRRSSSSRWSTSRWRRPTATGFTPVIAPALVKPETMEGTGFLGAHAAEVYRLADDDLYLVGTSPRSRWPATTPTRSSPDAAAALRRLLVLLPARGRLVRQGHQGHHPGALVRQGGDVLLRPGRRGARRAPAAARLGARVHRQARARLPGDRRRGRRPRLVRGAQVRHRGVVPVAGRLPRADLRRRTARRSRRGGSTSAPAATRGNEPVATLNGTLCAIARTIACLLDHHQQPDGSVYVPVALRPYLGGREAAHQTPSTVIRAGRHRPRRHAAALDGTVSRARRAALEAAEAAGLVVAFVTGRPPRWLRRRGRRDRAPRRRGRRERRGDLRPATETACLAHTCSTPRLLRDAQPPSCAPRSRRSRFAVEYGDGLRRRARLRPRLGDQPALRPARRPDPAAADRRRSPRSPTGRRVKLLAKDRDADADEFLAAAGSPAGRTARPSPTRRRSGCSRSPRPGVTKATGLAELAAQHGIAPDEVVAIGDMPNDVPMLHGPARSYAVGQRAPRGAAQPPTRWSAATTRTPSRS